ncbi:PREDICTED: unconventional myosin-XVIIIa-like [Nanorana parkeri]|uniref:unconventional myosin-XVIIIa-like n=1 Tax=Nanorana parkeri TaxID=125878 RepID=UPI000854ACE2|nr:PREDICTED: unconventional myosin-XVIIIa-like [Nanorana parkeri]
MTARLKRNSGINRAILSEVDPMRHLRHSFHMSRTNTTEQLPSIAGIGLGIQDVKSTTNVPFGKTAKSVPGTVTAEKPSRKSVVSIAVQVSSDEESAFLSKIQALQKENLVLRSSVKEKEDMVEKLNKTITNKTLQFAKDIELEVNSHETTRQSLDRSQRLVEEKEQLLNDNILHYENVSRELQSQYEETMAALREQSQIEVNIRDEKVNKLKQQISELFRDKSWEHQKQMEDLQKEISRLAEEAQLHRTQLKRDSTSRHACEKCKTLMAALEDSKIQMKLKNRTIEELQSLCQRFENQLQDQEKLQKLLLAKNRDVK